jgi:uncharacterized membrane protein YqjE
MAQSIKGTPFARSVSDLLTNLSDLLRKELELARAEMSSKLATKAQGGIWAGAAGLFGMIALLLVVQAVVFAIASFGIALHWSCLIVASVFLLGAAIAYWRARSDLQEDLTPTRTINQIKQDIAAAKEQWS